MQEINLWQQYSNINSFEITDLDAIVFHYQYGNISHENAITTFSAFS